MAGFGLRTPAWFKVAGVVFALWNAIGVAMFYMNATISAEALAELPEWDRNLRASLPGWYFWANGVATWAGLFGAIALLARRKWAGPLFWLSLIAVVITFGWLIAFTDMIAERGFASLGLPALILAFAVAQVMVARTALARRWLN